MSDTNSLNIVNPKIITCLPQQIRTERFSYKLDCITPDKYRRVENIISGTPNFESDLYMVWKNKFGDNYFVSNKINKDLYLISDQDIDECMISLQSYYTKLSIEIFEILIKYDFNIDNTIAELKWRYN